MNTFVGIFLLSALLFASSVPVTEKGLSLEDDFKKVLSLLPMEKFKSIAEAHLKNDTGFQAAIKYMQEDEWQNWIKTIRAHPDTIKFKAYLRNLGIDVDDILKRITDCVKSIKIDPIPDLTEKNLTPFIKEIEANIPTIKLLAALNESMLSNKRFQEIYEHLASPESKAIFEKFRNIPEVKNMMDVLKDATENHNASRYKNRELDTGWLVPLVRPILARIANNNKAFQRKNFNYLNKTKTHLRDFLVPKSGIVSEEPTILIGPTYHELFENRKLTIGPNMYTIDEDYVNRLKKLLKEAGVEYSETGIVLP